jgi:hypothetical protein
MLSRDAGSVESGGRLADQKNTWALTHSDAGNAQMLKRIRYAGWRRRASDSEMTRASSATINVPAAGPYRRVEVKTNVSEIEIVAGTDGSLTVADPVRIVNAARTNQFQPTGCV